MSTRRSFMASILAAGIAPAAVGSAILMPVRRIISPRPFLIGCDPGRFEQCGVFVVKADYFEVANPLSGYVLRVDERGFISGFGLCGSE